MNATTFTHNGHQVKADHTQHTYTDTYRRIGGKFGGYVLQYRSAWLQGARRQVFDAWLLDQTGNQVLDYSANLKSVIQIERWAEGVGAYLDTAEERRIVVGN